MHDDIENRTESGDEHGTERTKSDPGETSSLPLSRRPFLRGVTGLGLAGGLLGSQPDAVAGDSAATGTTDWEPAEVPFDMATPWYDQVSPETVHEEYPRPQLVWDEWRNLNGVWGFEAASPGDSPPIERDLEESILVPFPPESALSGIRRHEPRMWYRTAFSVPNEWLVPTAHPADGIGHNPDAQRLLLHFERVDWRTTVYVNGEEVTTHEGGYGSFSVDVTDYLTAEGDQELVVGVFDPTDTGTQPVGKQELQDDEDIFFTPTSGIWETVWIEPVEEAHIWDLELTPQVADETLALSVAAPDGTTVRAIASDEDGEVGRVAGPANERLSLPVPDPHLWSPDDPFLYDLNVELTRTTDGTRSGSREREHYQVDFVVGDPIEELGESGLYARENRLMRFAHGTRGEGVSERGTAWPSAKIRECLEYGHITTPDDGTAEVTFTVAEGCERTISLVVYSTPNERFTVDSADEQRLLDATTHVYGPGEHTISVDLPEEPRGGGVLDSVESYFGMRSVGKEQIRGVMRPTLNGEFVFHNGIYDQGYWPDGIYTAPTDEALRFDLQRAVDLEFNAYRKHIKVPPKRWYYWADRLGLLVWQDIPN